SCTRVTQEDLPDQTPPRERIPQIDHDSIRALGRRLAKKGVLPRINPAVDTYNAVSVRHGLPAGAFDLDHVTGDVDIRHADGTESFTPLGESDTTENPKPGEIIYADTTGVLTRHWNHRDAHRTRVTKDSTHVTFVLETLHATRDGDLLKVAAEELQGLLIPHAEQTAVHYLSPARPGHRLRPPGESLPSAAGPSPRAPPQEGLMGSHGTNVVSQPG
ncbi:B3/B4 domain-containing protein, partial [Streptomyces mirabilis]|uniref:B3/B4 domain-containing protein n=1 Tax=Streptomyces mirabilis TaxID=68239 RepID=UPI0033BAD48B